MKELENRMVIDSEWPCNRANFTMQKLNGPGYRNMNTGVFVPLEHAFDYAIEHCFDEIPEGLRQFKWTQEFRDMLVEWFYSGNWIRED